jgi:hypothetical protein
MAFTQTASYTDQLLRRNAVESGVAGQDGEQISVVNDQVLSETEMA